MTSDAPLSLPVAQQDARRRNFVGEVIGTQPAVKRASRTVSFRGYRVFVVVEIDSEGKAVKTAEAFKPTHMYDRAVLATNKYLPHQGERERVRRVKQLARAGRLEIDFVV